MPPPPQGLFASRTVHSLQPEAPEPSAGNYVAGLFSAYLLVRSQGECPRAGRVCRISEDRIIFQFFMSVLIKKIYTSHSSPLTDDTSGAK